MRLNIIINNNKCGNISINDFVFQIKLKLAVNLEFYGLSCGWILAIIALTTYVFSLGCLIVHRRKRYLTVEGLTVDESSSDGYQRRRSI